MNTVFYVFLTILIIIVYFILSFAFEKIGEISKTLFNKFKENISDKMEKENE